MSQVYNPETERMAEIERLELEARTIRRRIEHVTSDQDRRVLNKQLHEIEDQIANLQALLP
jgi:urease accessory protein UreE